VKQEKLSIKIEPQNLKEGDRVQIVGHEGIGTIQVIKGKNAVVQFGELKSVVNLSKLEKISGSPKPAGEIKIPSKGVNIVEKRAVFSNTLDIRGKRVEEVALLLDQFMDNAILLGHGEIRILHGKGEGVLRKVVRQHLRRYKEVASFADEHIERGGDGITVVILK